MAKYKSSGASVELRQMKYKDLKAACITLNMDFQDVIEADVHILKSYFVNNYYEERDPTKLEQYEDWVVEVLKAQGYKDDDPLLKFRQFSGDVSENPDDDPQIKRKVLKRAGIKKKVQKREKDTKFGIFKGTKKALAFQLADEGLPIEKAVQEVLKTFPDAKDKSIRIWYKKALKSKKP